MSGFKTTITYPRSGLAFIRNSEVGYISLDGGRFISGDEVCRPYRDSIFFFGKGNADWRHKYRVRSRDRDFQRSKVYSADRAVWAKMPQERMDWNETVEWIFKVTQNVKFRNRWGKPNIVVRDGRGRRRACGGGATVTLPIWCRHRWLILHELAHAICPDWEIHGRLWARTYLELVKMFMGREEYDTLRGEWRSRKIKFNARRVA